MVGGHKSFGKNNNPKINGSCDRTGMNRISNQNMTHANCNHDGSHAFYGVAVGAVKLHLLDMFECIFDIDIRTYI